MRQEEGSDCSLSHSASSRAYTGMLLSKGLGYISLAELDGTVVAANLYFCFKDTITHEIAAQDRRFFEYRPNYLLI